MNRFTFSQGGRRLLIKVVESPVLKGGFFCILGGLSMVMDSQEGEMTPGKKIGSKSLIVLKI